MKLGAQIQHVADVTPTWANWTFIAGSAIAAWIQPIAGVIAILWGCLQIYLADEKRWFTKKDK